jgi:hypothetical protein
MLDEALHYHPNRFRLMVVRLGQADGLKHFRVLGRDGARRFRDEVGADPGNAAGSRRAGVVDIGRRRSSHFDRTSFGLAGAGTDLSC